MIGKGKCNLRLGKVIITPFSVAAVVFLVLIDSTAFLIPIMLAAGLHEGGHALAVILLKKNIKTLKILPFGAELTIDSGTPLSYSQEIVTAAAGPAVNAILFILSALLFRSFPGNEYIAFFGGCNMAFFLINMLPVFPLDGGRMFSAILLKKLDIVKATRITDFVSFLFLMLILAFGLYILISTGYNFSLLLIFIFLLSSFLIRILKK